VWLLVVTLADPGPRLRWAVPLVLTVAVVNRVLVLVEGSYPLRRADVDGPARPPGPPVPGAPQAAAAERAA
jgi:hypothetical protein